MLRVAVNQREKLRAHTNITKLVPGWANFSSHKWIGLFGSEKHFVEQTAD